MARNKDADDTVRHSWMERTGLCDVCGEDHGHAWRGGVDGRLPCHPGGPEAQIIRQEQMVRALTKENMQLEAIKRLDWYDPRLEREKWQFFADKWPEPKVPAVAKTADEALAVLQAKRAEIAEMAVRAKVSPPVPKDVATDVATRAEVSPHVATQPKKPKGDRHKDPEAKRARDAERLRKKRAAAKEVKP